MSGRQLPNYLWIKFGLDYLNDPDFTQLADATTGVYLKLYLLAGRADAGGLLCNNHKVFSERDLSILLHLDQGILQTALTELIEAGFVKRDGEGYRITRFLDEQGPGNNAQREEWRERQQKHRAKVAGDRYQSVTNGHTDTDTDTDKDKEVEVESHDDVTVTELPANTPATPSSLSLFRSEIINLITQKGWKVDGSRLDECLSFWQELAKREGWRFKNPEAVIDLYAPGGLEERREREAAKQAKSNGREQAESKLPGGWTPEEADAMHQKIRAIKAQQAAAQATAQAD